MSQAIPKKGVFISGTSTNVGKTYVSALIASAVTEYRPVTYCKPVQTGCEKLVNGTLVAPDFDYVRHAVNLIRVHNDVHVPYKFELACSPHLAAQSAQVSLSITPIVEAVEALSQQAFVVVEGAGGVCTPLSETSTMLDCMCALGLPVLLVTTPELGTLNHTILSYDRLVLAGLTCGGIIFNNCDHLEEDFVRVSNKEFLKNRYSHIPFLEIGYKATVDTALKEFVHGLCQ